MKVYLTELREKRLWGCLWPSLARFLSPSHRFPMGASHSASAVTVGHLVMMGHGGSGSWSQVGGDCEFAGLGLLWVGFTEVCFCL